MSADCCSCGFQDPQFLAGKCGATFTVFMGLINLLLNKQCDIADPCHRLGRDGTTLLTEDNLEYDFIVVGAGVAGPVVASRLSENPQWKVLLIEAGPEEPTATELPAFSVSAVGTSLDWNYTTVSQKGACLSTNGICSWPRGKMVSGTSGMQGMMYTRGHRYIYDLWESLGNDGWGFDSVLPYFIKAEKNKNPSDVDEGYHGFNGPLVVQQFSYHPPMTEAVVEAAQFLGYRAGDLNGKNQTGVNIAQMMVDDGLRGSTPRMYLRPHYNRSNFQLSINTHVTKVLIDPTTKKAYGVEVLLDNGDTRTIQAKKEVILSAGSIGSPQILLLSGVGPKEDLEDLGISVLSDIPVGRNLHNHVSVALGFLSNDTGHEALTIEAFSEFVRTHRGPMASTGLTQTTAFLKSKYAENDVPDLQVFFDGFNAACSRTGLQEECTDGSLSTCGRRYINSRPTNVWPLSVGSLKLKSTNPLEYPILDPQYLSVERDVEVLVEGLKMMIEMSKTPALQRWGLELVTTPAAGCENLTFGTDEYFACVVRQHTGPENHQAGSCRMGPVGDQNSVVDPQLRVIGVGNLRVADASIFPRVPNANPTAAIVMVGEKAADMIKETWNNAKL
ncbi:glucose dehydrogenase [FAD, quinone] isoform X2 [Anabrus simplex]